MAGNRCTRFVVGLLVAPVVLTAGSGASSAKGPSRLQAARRVLGTDGSVAAVGAFKQAAAEAPDDGKVWCEYGWVASRAGDDRQAARALDAGIRLLSDESPSASLNKALGGCLYERGKVAERLDHHGDAAEYYRRSLRTRPGDAETNERRVAMRDWLQLEGDLSWGDVGDVEADGETALVVAAKLRPWVDTSGDDPKTAWSFISADLVDASTFSRTKGTSLTYWPDNAVDGDRQTAWQISDGGVGHWIRLRFDEPERIAGLGIVSGYDKSVADRYGDRWPLNNRVSRVRIEWDGGAVAAVLRDRRAMQWIDLGAVTSSWLRVRITDVFPGSRWSDTAISELLVEAAPAEDETLGADRAAAGFGAKDPDAMDDAVVQVSAATQLSSGADGKAGPPAGGGMDNATAEQEDSGSGWLPSWLLFLLSVAVFGGLLIRRSVGREQRQLGALLRRAHAAEQAINAEVEELGDAYLHAAIAGADLRAQAPRIVAHIQEIRAALKRTRRLTSPQVAEHRARLERQGETATARLHTIVDRLEETAAELAAQRAGHAVTGGVDRLLTTLRREIDVAVTADDEARSLFDVEGSSFAVLRESRSS